MIEVSPLSQVAKMYRWVWVRACGYICICIFMCIYIFMYIYAVVLWKIDISPLSLASLVPKKKVAYGGCGCVCAYVDTYIHIYVHTYIHGYMFLCIKKKCVHVCISALDDRNYFSESSKPTCTIKILVCYQAK